MSHPNAERAQTTRWTTDPSSKVNFPDAIYFDTFCFTSLVTSPHSNRGE